MRYFYDTEFIDDGSTIDLISIGVVAEDGREYYAQSRDCKFRLATDWVVRNVFIHLQSFDMVTFQPTGKRSGADIYHDSWAETAWKTRREIRDDLTIFCDLEKYGKPEFWGYYSAYDHVALCQLFGAMTDLPKGWPMWTRDLKQWCWALGGPDLPTQGKSEHDALADACWNRDVYKFLSEYNRKAIV